MHFLTFFPKIYIPSTLNTVYLLENSGLKSRYLFCLMFQFYLMYRLICQKPAHFLSAQMALVNTFFQMFIVLGMYNFAFFIGNMLFALLYMQILLQCRYIKKLSTISIQINSAMEFPARKGNISDLPP